MKEGKERVYGMDISNNVGIKLSDGRSVSAILVKIEYYRLYVHYYANPPLKWFPRGLEIN